MRSLAFVLLAVLTVVTVALHHGAAAAAKGGDLRLSRIASELARRPVTIRCEGASGALTGPGGESGRTGFIDDKPVSTSYLQTGICETLHVYARSLKACLLPCRQPLESAWSLNTLAHESYHLAGVRNEAETECYALQNTAFVAERLGVPTQAAKDLQAWLYERGYPNEPTEYQSPKCYDGGPLDLRPQQTLFP
jgi:hypothetical protein